MKKIVISIAMRAEIEPSILQKLQTKYNNLEILYTGVGKIKAGINLTQKINDIRQRGDEVDYVLNLGTSGGRGLRIGDVVCCNQFFQKDMNISALGLKPGFDLNTNYGFNGCEQKEDENGEYIYHKNFNLPFKNVICATTDSFTNDLSPLKPEQEVSVEEMEAYALALTSKVQEIDFIALKYVSNKLGAETNLKEQGEDFDRDVKEKHAQNQLVKALETTIKEMENKRSMYNSFLLNTSQNNSNSVIFSPTQQVAMPQKVCNHELNLL